MRSLLLLSFLWSSIAVFQAAAAVPSREQQCRDILNEALQDKNPDTRKQAAIALSLVGSNDPFAARLDSLLDDKDVQVRLAAVESIRDIKSDRMIPALHKALKDTVPEVSFAAAQALFALNDPEGKKALLEVAEGESKTSSGYFTKQIRDTMRLMHTPKTAILFAVKQGVGFAPVPGIGEGISSMQALLSDPSVSGRATAILLLEKDKDQQTLNALLEALNAKDWSVRAAAVHALVVRGNPAFQSDIVPLLDDKNQGVRLRAAAGYLRLESMKTRRKPLRRRSRQPIKKNPKPQA